MPKPFLDLRDLVAAGSVVQVAEVSSPARMYRLSLRPRQAPAQAGPGVHRLRTRGRARSLFPPGAGVRPGVTLMPRFRRCWLWWRLAVVG